MLVYFLRHASAGQPKGDPMRDEKRPLDKQGMEQCSDMGRTLAALNAQVDAVISSSLKRATQTASLVANEIGFDGKMQTSPALRPDASYESFRQLLDKHSASEAIMVVGHNPTLSQFLSLLITGGATDSAVDLKKGAVAKVECPARRAAVLKWCLTPKTVRAIYETTAASSRPKTARK